MRSSAVSVAWEQFQAGQEPRGVRPEVLTSWRRSQISGVDPEYVEVPHAETDLDSSFARVAAPIMTRMAELLVGDRSCLALSDPAGSVIWRWVSEPMLRTTLDGLSVVEGFNFGEEFVGTNGLGTALETGGLAIVRGCEHFVHRFHDVTCVAAPVRHPITRRTVGAVNVTCRAADTNSLLGVLVRKLVEEIQSALHAAATARERHLLSEFLEEQRHGTGPVAVVGDDLIIANRQAADLGLDRSDLWDEIRAARGADTLALPADLTARVRMVGTGGKLAGAVLTLADTPHRPGSPARHTRRSGWGDDPQRRDVTAARTAELAAQGPVAVCGEAGSGRTTVLRAAFAGTPAVLDAAARSLDPMGWAAELRQHLGSGPVIIRHVEVLDLAAVRTLAAAVGDPAELRGRLGLTITVPDGQHPAAPAARLLDALVASTVTVAPLRRMPDAIATLAQRELRQLDPGMTFAADALAVLRRHRWPGNLAELARVVRDAARDTAGPVVTAADLPVRIRNANDRRPLTPLERAESSVIESVLRKHGGNKSTAARELGISRTALYAKIRTYRI